MKRSGQGHNISLKLSSDWLVNIEKKNFKSGDKLTHTNPDKPLLNCSFAVKEII